ncbi:substrate-binding domain-containing protein, partial [Micromonospora sp. NPDC003776]
MTEPRQTGADVRSLTDTLIAHAQSAGGQLTSAQLARTVESAEVTPAQAKKILRALSEAGVTVVVDGSASTRRRVAAARSATPASRATTAKTTKKAAAPAPKQAPAAEEAPAAPAPRKATARKAAGTTAEATKSSERWIADGANVVKNLRAKGYKTKLVYGEDDPDQQVAQFENLITLCVKGMIIAAIDNKSLYNVLQEAADSNIPVIA